MHERERKPAAFRVSHAIIEGVDAVEADTSHIFGRHMHDQFGIGFIGRGAQVSSSGRGVVEAGAGDVITVNPCEVHDGAPIGDNGRAWQMLYFEPRVIMDIVHDVTQGKVTTIELPEPVIHDPRVRDSYHSLFSAMTASIGAAQQMHAEQSLFLLVEQLVDQGIVKRETSVPRAIAAARSKIDDDPAAALTLADLATFCGVTRFQVIRAFVRATGLTPHAYMIQRRLQMARRMIVGGTDLAETAAVSGFADQSHMTRLFVRTYGMSPGYYALARR